MHFLFCICFLDMSKVHRKKQQVQVEFGMCVCVCGCDCATNFHHNVVDKGMLFWSFSCAVVPSVLD